MQITILVAYDENRVIGFKGTIPWKISKDFAIFKQRTLGHSIVMGENTWNSLPQKPLPGRHNIVLTYLSIPGVDCVTSFEEAINLAQKDKEIFIIGGQMVYNEALRSGKVDRVLATIVPGIHEGDTFFPELDWPGKIVEEYEEFKIWEFTKE